jgi:hypothetical protein
MNNPRLLACLIFFGIFGASAQTKSGEEFLQNRYETDFTLKGKRYYVSEDVVVEPGAVLTITDGAELVFYPGTNITVQGGLKIEGAPNRLVRITSRNPESIGLGIFISGENSHANISIRYASFSYLSRPLKFEKYWYRPEVSVTHSEFRDIHNYDKAVIVSKDEFLNDKPVCQFVFSDNMIADNLSSIYFQQILSEKVKYNISNNVYVNNYFIAQAPGGKSNPLYLGKDFVPGSLVPKIHRNYFISNYVYAENGYQLLDIGSIGYTGHGNLKEVNTNYIVNYMNDSLPPVNREVSQVSINDYDAVAGRKLPAIVKAVIVDGVDYTNSGKPVSFFMGKTIYVKFSNSVRWASPKLFLHQFDTVSKMSSVLLIDSVKFNVEDSLSVSFTIPKMKQNGISYLSNDGFQSAEGFAVPTLNLGYKNFIREIDRYGRTAGLEGFDFYQAVKGYKEMNSVSPYFSLLKYIDTSLFKYIDTTQKEALVDKFPEPKYEIGISVGTTMYYGDLNSEIYDFRAAKNYVGIRLRYNRWKSFSLIGSFNVGQVSGDDNYSPLTSFRGLSFKSFLFDMGVLAEYHLTPYSIYKNNITTSFVLGLNLVGFNPQANYFGTWVNLRNLPTEDTKTHFTDNYKKATVGIPIGISLKKTFSKRFTAALDMTYNLTFTDYLDDVSHNYPDLSNNSNPMARELADPTYKAISYTQRGNPAINDSYLLLGFSFYYKLSPKMEKSIDNIFRKKKSAPEKKQPVKAANKK